MEPRRRPGADRAHRSPTRGWTRHDIYDDGGRQGDDPDRPGFLQMLSEVDQFDVLIIRDLDRFSRKLAIYASAVDDAGRGRGRAVRVRGRRHRTPAAGPDRRGRPRAGRHQGRVRPDGEGEDQAPRPPGQDRAGEGRRPPRRQAALRLPLRRAEHGPSRLVVDPVEAAVVRRMFDLAADDQPAQDRPHPQRRGHPRRARAGAGRSRWWRASSAARCTSARSGDGSRRRVGAPRRPARADRGRGAVAAGQPQPGHAGAPRRWPTTAVRAPAHPRPAALWPLRVGDDPDRLLPRAGPRPTGASGGATTAPSSAISRRSGGR